MEYSIKFWDKIAQKYSKQPVKDEESYRKKLESTQKLMHEDMEVLEFGCGTGSTALTHSPYVKRIVAIDYSEKMIQIAKEKAKTEQISNVTFARASIDEFAAEDESIDMVLGLNVVHLIDNMESVFEKVYKMLKPGGTFISSTVCLGDGFSVLRLVLPIGIALRKIPKVKMIKHQQLIDGLTSKGFVIEEDWHQKDTPAYFIIARKPTSDIKPRD